MRRVDPNVVIHRKLTPKSDRLIRWVVLSLSFGTGTATAQDAAHGWDNPFDHALEFNAPTIGTHDTTYTPDALAWTVETRVLAIQSVGPVERNNWDMIVESGGTEYVSQNQDASEVDFVLFDGSAFTDDQRSEPPTTATIYHNGEQGGVFYQDYVCTHPFDQWDGENGYADFHMDYSTLVAAKTLYLKAGAAYRFDIDRTDGSQSGFASLMRTDPNTRIQPRSQAVAEFGWNGSKHPDFVFVPEEGLYTLVVLQKNGDALGLATVRNSQVVPRGTVRVNDNTVRINVSAE
jgi:hypothetical protein